MANSIGRAMRPSNLPQAEISDERIIFHTPYSSDTKHNTNVMAQRYADGLDIWEDGWGRTQQSIEEEQKTIALMLARMAKEMDIEDEEIDDELV